MLVMLVVVRVSVSKRRMGNIKSTKMCTSR